MTAKLRKYQGWEAEKSGRLYAKPGAAGATARQIEQDPGEKEQVLIVVVVVLKNLYFIYNLPFPLQVKVGYVVYVNAVNR